ncbi:MAG: signal recognition particle receptor subunit alpha, partial [Candidatus Kapaibacterium sp.]
MGLFDGIKKKLASAASTVVNAFSVERLRDGLEKTRTALTSTLRSLVQGRRIDKELLADVEDLLLRADVGVTTTERILTGVQRSAAKAGITEGEKVLELIENEIAEILVESPSASSDASF